MVLSEAIEGQRRQVSVLFADIVGFTAIAERIGEEASFRMIQVISSKMMEAVHEQGGSVQEFRGDGIMALFGAPVALEDAPLRACRAALAIQQIMADLGDQLERDHKARPAVRIGIHAGQLVVGDVGDDQRMRFTAIGDTVNLAARLEAQAESGTIYVSDTLHGMVDGRVDATDLGLHDIKGKSKQQKIYRLDGLRLGVSRFDAARHQGLTQLLERDKPLETLAGCFETAMAGKKQVVHLIGEAGIGKSRLMHEFQQRLKDQNVRVLQGDCRADGVTTPFLPFVELVRTAFGIKKSDTRDTIESYLTTGLDRIGFDVAESLPYLMTLLGQDDKDTEIQGISADVVGMRLRQLLMDLLWHSCRNRTVALFIEDLHWIDPGSEDLLNRIALANDDVSLMLVTAFRPYYTPPWAAHSDAATITLEPLSRDGTVQLLSERLGVTDLGAELVRLAVEKVEGNPLYAEEIAKFLQEKNDPRKENSLGPSDLVLPANLQNLVMDRFDRLSKDTKTMLQAASVAGRRFSSEMIREIVGLDSDAKNLMAEAEYHELVLPIKDRDADFIFKHALVQDAIYDTLMAAQRRRLHADVGLAIERKNEGRIEEVADSLAYHFELSSLHEKAVQYLATAGRKSLNIFSLEVADDCFARAVNLIDTSNIKVGDELYATILKYWLETRQWTAAFGGTFSLFEPRLESIRKLKDTRYYPHILGILGTAYVQLMRFEEAETFLDEAMALGEERNDIEAIAHASIGLMGLHCVRRRKGSAELIQKLSDRILATELHENLYYRTYCRFFATWSVAIRGDLDTSLKQGHETVRIGQQENYPGAVGFGMTAVAYNETFLENYAAAIRTADEGSRLSGGVVDKAICDGIKGLALVLSGNGQEGLDLLQRIYDELTEMQYFSMYNIVEMPIGLAKATLGDLSGGIKWIESVAHSNLQVGNTHGAGMAFNALGEVYMQIATGKERPSAAVLRQNFVFLLKTIPFAKSKAIKCFETAAEIGAKDDMFGLQAMALLNKARALNAGRKTDAARQTLRDAKAVMAHIKWGVMEDKIDAALAEMA